MKKATVILRAAQNESSAGDELFAIGKMHSHVFEHLLCFLKFPGFMLFVHKESEKSALRIFFLKSLL